MARKTLEEFYESYEKPTIGEVVVGFSGIDPQKKSWGNGLDTSSTLPEPIKEEINEVVRANLEYQTIVFDGGEIN